ncbi:MAG: tRNA uridine-5-carboxymethylaminomethyl(34) synthesis GTPase MnmE [Rhodovibrionaceae bacterium]
MSDTIFALSTSPGRAGIAVLRISGPAAGQALNALCGGPLPQARRASLRSLTDPDSGAVIDRGLVLWFPAPHSFTGEDLVELQVHGGAAVIAALASALARQPGLRPGEAGEFTRRAFDAGKLDLTQVEGLADLIAAETEAQRRQALRQMDGALSRVFADWAVRLTRMLAQLEAYLDFPDEDLPVERAQAIDDEILCLENEIDQYLVGSASGERLRSGVEIAILGPPNAGKSSLLNALAQRDAAIISETAGTTRDVVEVQLDLGGFPATLADTAGLRALSQSDAQSDAQSDIEREGIRRAKARAERADLQIAVFDLSAGAELDPETLAVIGPDALVVLNKADLAPEGSGVDLAGRETFILSVKTGAGVGAFLAALEARVAEALSTALTAPSLTRARHRHALQACRAALARAGEAELPELEAEDLRVALRALGRITGKVDVEDLLDVIFREFCIGK